MPITYAFDVYGTLIDPLGISEKLAEELGEESGTIAVAWREKQLEYLFRRALMGRYEDFSVCTAQALDHALARFGRSLTSDGRKKILAAYRRLPAYPGAADALAALRTAGHRVFAFSNGLPDDLDELLRHAALHDSLDGVISVHPTRSYKPDPAVYRHFTSSTGSDARETALVSGNPFDIVGAAACGWQTIWVRRDDNAVFDPWEFQPGRIVTSLDELE